MQTDAKQIEVINIAYLKNIFLNYFLRIKFLKSETSLTF